MWKGIDVSDNQGIINWQKAKAAGVMFAVLRSVRGSGKTDYEFLNNYSGCQVNSIPVSVYKYTYADTEEKARTEAAQVVSLLNSVNAPKTTMVWWDVEDRPTLYNLGGMRLTAIIKAAKETIEAAGYRFGIYVGLYVYRENWFDFSQFKDVPLWVARYPSTTQKALSDNPSESYKPEVGRDIWGWQYSSNGRVDGISTTVDLDICYQNPTQECPEADQTAGKAEQETTKAVQKTVTANVLNIRAEPSASSADLGDLIKGSVITVDKTQGSWAHFEGWCSTSYLK